MDGLNVQYQWYVLLCQSSRQLSVGPMMMMNHSAQWEWFYSVLRDSISVSGLVTGNR
jgi:hypothetical protein